MRDIQFFVTISTASLDSMKTPIAVRELKVQGCVCPGLVARFIMGKDRCSQPVVADSLDISLYYFVGFRLRSDVFISVISSHIQHEC